MRTSIAHAATAAIALAVVGGTNQAAATHAAAANRPAAGKDVSGSSWAERGVSLM